MKDCEVINNINLYDFRFGTNVSTFTALTLGFDLARKDGSLRSAAHLRSYIYLVGKIFLRVSKLFCFFEQQNVSQIDFFF